MSAYIYGFRSACASWANNASTEITINSMYLSLIDGNKARVLSCTADKESLIFPSEDNFISPSRDKFQAAALSRVFTLGSLMRKLMQRRALAHNACVYVYPLEDDIRGNFIIIYYFFNHTTQPSFHCCDEKAYMATHSALLLEMSKALFASPTWQLRRAHYGLLFLEAVRGWKSKCLCEWARTAVKNALKRGVRARWSHSVSDKPEFSSSAFSILRNAKEMPREQSGAHCFSI